MKLALKYKLFSDIGFIIIMVITCIPCFVKSISIMQNDMLVGIVTLVVGSLGLFAIFLVATNNKRRKTILSNYEFQQLSDETLKFVNKNN